MLCPKCFTCGVKLCHIEIPFILGRQDILNNDKLKTKKERDDALTELTNKLVENDCCRMRLTQYVDLIQ
jgi:DNA-directed RNA polymerase subunit N (RpoN/RPB10)